MLVLGRMGDESRSMTPPPLNYSKKEEKKVKRELDQVKSALTGL